MKRKSPARLRSDLLNELRPEITLAALANEIKALLDRHIGKSVRNANVAHNLAACLTQKYSVTHRTAGALGTVIEYYGEDLARFLDQIRFKQYQLLDVDQLPRTTKTRRRKPQTATERAQLQKEAKSRHDSLRREYRVGLIVKQFGTSPTFFSAEEQSECADAGSLWKICLESIDTVFLDRCPAKVAAATCSMGSMDKLARNFLRKWLPYSDLCKKNRHKGGVHNFVLKHV